jgi:site-specific recombinase XerD
MPSKIKGKEGVLCLQLIRNRKIKLLRTRFRLYSCEWNIETGSVRFENADWERIHILQSVKTGLEAELRQIGDLVRLLETKGEYTVGELAALYANHSFNGYFFSFTDFVIKNLKDNNRRKTAAIYVTATQSFARFRSGQDILIDHIDNDLLLQYETYLKNSGMLKNSASCYLRALRSIYNQAVKRGLCTQKNPFKGTYTGIAKTAKRAVNEEIIIQFKKLDLSRHKELAFARDLFMFSFYMRGMSFVDIANLRKSNVRNGYIVYVRNKTKQIQSVKIEACIQEIISRYEAQTTHDYLLPVCTTQNGDYTNKLRTFNKRLRRISVLLGLERPLSSYVTRHSWATVALRKGIPVEVISESMGHENETTTRIYLASLGQSVVDKANMEIIKL